MSPDRRCPKFATCRKWLIDQGAKCEEVKANCGIVPFSEGVLYCFHCKTTLTYAGISNDDDLKGDVLRGRNIGEDSYSNSIGGDGKVFVH